MHFFNKNGPNFWPSILKWWKGQKYFWPVFIVLCFCLFTTKLRCLQKNNLGHSNGHAVGRQIVSRFLNLRILIFSHENEVCYLRTIKRACSLNYFKGFCLPCLHFFTLLNKQGRQFFFKYPARLLPPTRLIDTYLQSK